ncbi:MAG: LptF/LptG family permease [Kiritimatiellaeota bacterium]|nr:LptF/LptG family permease [Kiritimatiellota bacterium]
MRVLERYLLRDFLVTCLLTLTVITFVMCLGTVVKAVDLLARGVSGIYILKIFIFNIPFLLSFAIPISVLTTVLLLFGRLSSDGELNAMKACGLSLWQIITPIVLAAVCLSGLCLYLNGTLAPLSHWAQRRVLVELGMTEPENLLEEGRFVREFPGLMVYVAKRERKKVTDVIVYEMGPQGIKRSVRAQRGFLTPLLDKQQLRIDLYDVRIEAPDENYPNDLTRSHDIRAAHYPVTLDLSGLMGKGQVHKKVADMTYGELIEAVQDVSRAFPGVAPKDLARTRMKLVVDANTRLGLALSCFAFTLLGIPLGIKSHRRETSIGFAISILIVFFFYFFLFFADALVRQPELRPDLIVWVPVLLSEVVGYLLLRRSV